MNALPSEVPTDRRLSVIFLFAGTLFTSASLMFVLQPLFGKLLLPLLGGSPAVWNTCMVFYQSLLFLGYWYAHTLSTRMPVNRQILLHASVMLLSLLALPVALPEQLQPPTDSNPTFWLLWTLFLAIGLPFFVVSTTAPLLQKWFAQVGHQSSHDPYFLYAASNTGSLIALLSYPFLLEPKLGLAAQKLDWSFGYGLLCLLIAACAVMLWKNQEAAKATIQDELELEAPDGRKQLHWLLLALVPSSLLLGLTNFISTDIASVPLLWIIPLTLYLLSFILVFSKWHQRIHALMLRLQPIFLVPFLAFAFVNPGDLPYWAYLILHLVAFFFAIMVCHGELAISRPHTRYLTRYYLIMSFAGMLGGMFNTFVAPFIFNGIYEYLIMIVLALALRPGLTSSFNRYSSLQIVVPVLLIGIGFALYLLNQNLLDYFDVLAITLMVICLLTYLLRKQPVGFALLTGAIILLSQGLHGLSAHTLWQERSFFGVLAVRESVLMDDHQHAETYHELFHGTTKHGAERLTQEMLKIPLTYYSQPGPMGQLFKAYDKTNEHWTIGIIGLGAGAMTCYSKPQQNWILYEIDPLVVKTAENTDYFHYLDLCAKNSTMRLGDARLSLAKEADHSFDLLVMDAFSSDSVPTHLLTEEAIKLYLKKLRPDGIIAFHITNRHLMLKKVLSIQAEQLHLAALIEEYQPHNEPPLVVATDWVVMANRAETLEPLLVNERGNWQKMPLYFDMKPWTDDFTNIVDIWK